MNNDERHCLSLVQQSEKLKGKKKPVEQRKTASVYLKFIKSSQRFYRSYIKRLASRYGGVREIEAIAQKFSFDASASEGTTKKFTERRHVLQSCHQTLIHLGDLSRYRESELDGKKNEKNWGPAIGYYDLAIAIIPYSGLPYNQLAIISKAEGDHARALYNLYRALSAFDPPPTAFDNLSLEFRKIREAWNRNQQVTDTEESSDDPLANLQRWLPALHSCCFDGAESGQYDNLESKVLGQLATGLRERSVKTNFVNRMVLSNIAADFAAGDRWQDAPELSQNEHAFKTFQRLNVRTFSAMLRLLQAEYKTKALEHKSDDTAAVTFVVRRLLPGVRYYQFWLASRATLLSVHLGDSTMGCFIKEFWTIYANLMSVLLSSTHFGDLPQLEYLLEEDKEIIGFRPLQEWQQRHTILIPESNKPICYERGVKRHHPNIEMLCRVRDLVQGALELANSDYVPIRFSQGNGCFAIEEDLCPPEPSSASLDQSNDPSTTAEPKDNVLEDHISPDAESTTDDAASLGPSISLSTTMNQMVDNLVGPERSADAVHPSTPIAASRTSTRGANGVNETSFGVGETTLTALNFVNQVRSWSPKGPAQEVLKLSLPSILNSPFAPQPDEKNVLTQPPAAMSNHSRQNSQQQRLPQCSLESIESSMSDPTQLSYVANGPLLHPSLDNEVLGNRQHHAILAADDFTFNSSNIITGSSFPYNNTGRDHMTQPTPPNGQG
ncbi:MAG: hypothetical protein Q9201_004897 [Fulgogasparrea decipioides]